MLCLNNINMKTRLLLVALFSTGLLLHSQSTTSIPDDNFENYLETHNANGQIDTYPNTMGDGVMGNNIVETAKISSVTTLNVINLGIMSLSGIEDFAALLVLNCQDNDLPTLDVSSNSNLSTLVCQDNPLTSLNLGTIPQLSQLFCSNTQLTNIDLTPFINLNWLEVYNNPLLTNLDLSGNPVLQRLVANNSPIGNIDFTGKTFLSYLYLNNCSVTNIDVSPIWFLRELEVSDNSLTSLDLTSNNLELRRVICNNNNLTVLNVNNGINDLITGANFNALNNSLTCIAVDDVAYSTNNWLNIDGGVTFSSDCSLGIEDNLIDFITIYPNPFKDVLYIKSNSDSSYQLFDLIGRQLNQGYFRQGTNNIPTSSLAPGTFLLKLNSRTSSITKKIIKSL